VVAVLISSSLTYMVVKPDYSERYYLEVIKACEGTLSIYQGK